MSCSHHLESLRCSIDKALIKNYAEQYFSPEGALDSVITKEHIFKVVRNFTSKEKVDEVTDYIVNHAKKVFTVLVIIERLEKIENFIRRDQLLSGCIDNHLPFDLASLETIFKDRLIARNFFRTQWEFCAPVFSLGLIDRVLQPHTVLPYRTQKRIAGGGFGSVYQIEIDPNHRPGGYQNTKYFARKRLELHEETYKKEVEVLTYLLKLDHPNILRLLACYSHSDGHNLISPLIEHGTLKEFLTKYKPLDLSRGEMFCMMAGLGSAIYALHDIPARNNEPPQKGNHHDIHSDNILFDGHRFIVADFGLSSIKAVSDRSVTLFKGGAGFVQPPECTDLTLPYKVRNANQASDIFQLGCTLTDLLVHFVYGPGGVKRFERLRAFSIGKTSYWLFHKGDRPNDAVAAILDEIQRHEGSESTNFLVQLLTKMLKLDPAQRPSAKQLVADLYHSTTLAFAEQLSTLFAKYEHIPDAVDERARFRRWKLAFNPGVYSDLPTEAMVRKTFDHVIKNLRQMVQALESIGKLTGTLDCRNFLEIRRLNTDMLELLFGPTNIPQELIVVDNVGPCKIAKMLREDMDAYKLVLVETIQCSDRSRYNKLQDRMGNISALLSTNTRNHQLRTPPFHSMKRDESSFSFHLLYDFAKLYGTAKTKLSPVNLLALLKEANERQLPSLEVRFELAARLAESLAQFHEKGWFHKDLTSSSILFFPPTTSSDWINKPYIAGFQHSRQANDDFTEGPLQDRSRHRYHHPKYISVQGQRFKRFKQRYDYYSLGVLLLEIGHWKPVENIMSEHVDDSNDVFAERLIGRKLDSLRFTMGSKYVAATKQCLTGWAETGSETNENRASEARTTLLFDFESRVVGPLKSINGPSEEVEGSAIELETDDSSGVTEGDDEVFFDCLTKQQLQNIILIAPKRANNA